MDNCVSYLYPNESGEVLWSLMIVVYPYVTGLVAGAFVVSSLYHVFDRKSLQPVARLSLVASLAFLLVATLPLLAHLGHPERCFNILITPNFRSAMAAFGFIYTTYMLLLILEVWLVYRIEIIRHAENCTGLTRFIFRLLTLGVYNTSEESRKFDHKTVTFLAGLGIPLACILHGYVGFLFGSVKANPWWSSPLVPVVFLLSAITSGIAAILLLYLVVSRLSRKKIDIDCVHALGRWLFLFAVLTFTLEMLEIVCLAYEGNAEWLILKPLLFKKIAVSFWGVQVLFGAVLGISCLLGVTHLKGRISSGAHNTLACMGSICLLVQVAAMRWNVVIGGQLFSKSMRGFRADYVPEFMGREGILMALIICLLPLIILFILGRYLPLLPDEEKAPLDMS